MKKRIVCLVTVILVVAFTSQVFAATSHLLNLRNASGSLVEYSLSPSNSPSTWVQIADGQTASMNIVEGEWILWRYAGQNAYISESFRSHSYRQWFWKFISSADFPNLVRDPESMPPGYRGE